MNEWLSGCTATTADYEEKMDSWLIALQSRARASLIRRKQRENVILEVQNAFGMFIDGDKTGKELRLNTEVLRLIPFFLRNVCFPEDLLLFSCVCRHMIMSMDCGEKDRNMTTLFLSKCHLPPANALVTNIYKCIPSAMHSVSGQKASEQKSWHALIHWMILFSGCGGWTMVRTAPQVHPILNSLCNKMSIPLMSQPNYVMLTECLFRSLNDVRPSLSSEAINALFTILLRPLKGTQKIEDEVIMMAAETLFSCPAVVHHVNDISREIVKNTTFLSRVVPLLNRRGLKSGNHSKTVNLMANIIHISFLKMDDELVWEWAELLGAFISSTKEITSTHGRGRLHWHPIFGNCSFLLDAGTEQSLHHVVKQLRLLWSRRLTQILFQVNENQIEGRTEKKEEEKNSLSKLWNRLSMTNDASKQLHSSKLPVTRCAVISHMYTKAAAAFPTLKSDMYAGLCTNQWLFGHVWREIEETNKGINVDSVTLTLSLYQENSALASIHLGSLHLFAETSIYLIKILDDDELYEKGLPIPLDQLVTVARFANLFCFRSIWNGDVKGDDNERENELFDALHKLCILLYGRNSHRPFTNDPKLWFPPEAKTSSIVSEYEKQTARGILLMHKMPHVVPIKDRMLLFRKHIQNERASMEARPRMITVVRNQIVEDGYRQLSEMSAAELRSTIRVKFINQQGLDEAGIDQDGVFKEFLELTLKAVFDPNLSLFSFTSAGQLHPSSISHIHHNHLDLFRFVGKMLAKAIYEGIVVDVQLAPVMLATLLGERSLCAFDELAQFDPELYRSLSYVKKASEEEIADMGLTFSTNDNLLGKIVTVDIVPAGRTVPVTHENKINYVHRMAHYRVFTQTKTQCRAFVDGFQMIVKPSWLFLFAPHELQILISGENSDINLLDLRKNVQYYGGFHSSHRLIKWLWQILEDDFTVEERRLFLKDTGDTLGSVVRGFLSMKKSAHSTHRLPTASTCFNLLKLPNYNKKVFCWRSYDMLFILEPDSS